MSTLKILFIIYDLERGGPEMRLLDFVRNFPKDIKIHICVTSKNLSLLREFQKTDVDIKVVPVKKAYMEIKKVNEISKYVALNRISIINTFDLKGLMISAYIKKFSPTRVKIVHHVVDLLHNYNFCQKALLFIFLKYANCSITNSKQAKKILVDKYTPNNDIKVICNGVDTQCFNNDFYDKKFVRKKLNIGEYDIIIGTIANFRKVKNYPFLFKAFNILTKKHPDLKLLCVGGGKELASMKSVAVNYSMEDNIIFTGYSSNVVEYLSVMDIFVLCSLHEGMPNVITQAMSMNIPIIASSVGGCPEIIENMQNGILFSSNNYKEFIEAVEKLINDPETSSILADNAKKTVEDKFSLNLMVKNYVTFFKNMNEQ